jgi:hypothetical protein
MNPGRFVMFAFTSCHHVTNSSSFPTGDRNTLINVTAMTDLPPPFFTVCFPHLFTQELSNQSGDLQGFFDRSEMAGLINNFELRTGNL